MEQNDNKAARSRSEGKKTKVSCLFWDFCPFQRYVVSTEGGDWMFMRLLNGAVEGVMTVLGVLLWVVILFGLYILIF